MRACSLWAVLIATVTASSALSAPCPVRASWPTTSWPSRVAEVRAAKAAPIQALEDYAFTLTGKDEERLGLRTEALLIIKSGELVYERYARGFTETNRHISWSVAKSVSSALTGIAVAKGVLSVSDSICQHWTGVREDLCAVTLKDVLEFGTGIQWQETYEDVGYQGSSVIAMLLGEGRQNMPSFVLTHRKVAEPGKRYNYSTGDANLLLSLVNHTASKSLGKDWMWTELFDRIGMTSTVVEGDPQGNPAGGSYVFATPRDFARFGFLFLNDGCWDGERLLPEAWVAESTVISPTFAQGADAENKTPNGRMWWLNQVPPLLAERPWPDAPADTYAATGHWGQYVIVIPSQDVVIVRVGDDRNEGLKLNTLIPLALAVAP